MKCPGCGTDVMDGSKNCPKCGRELSLGTRAVGETAHVAKEAEMVAGKLGRGAFSGVKGLVSDAKKEFKRKDSEKKE